MSDDGPMSNDVELPADVVELTDQEQDAIEEVDASASNDVETASIVVENEPIILEELDGEDGEDEIAMDEEGQKWTDEGFADSVGLSIVNSTLYSDYFDNFGNARRRSTLE
jgi:hypothetical protein